MFDSVAELAVRVKELATEDYTAWPGAALTERVARLLGTRERFEVEVVRAVASWDGAEAWGLDGGVTPASWLMARFPIARADARRLVDLAGVYHRYPQVAAALDGAEITLLHLRLMAKAEKGRVRDFEVCADVIVEAARRKTVEEFAEFIDQWIDLVDDSEPSDDSKRGWFARPGFAGLASGELMSTEENLALIRSVLDLHDTPDAGDCPEGPRTKGQRDHDIFMDLFRWLLANKLDGDPDPAGGADIVLDPHTAAELMANPDDQLGLDSANPMADLLAPFLGDHDHGLGCCDDEKVCEHTSGEKANPAFAATLLCTGWVRRIVTDPDTGVVIDVGRRYRLFTRTQRRALIYRDRGCVFPGCTRPARFCDAHHIKPWEEGGLTDLVNGVLLCRRHHTLVHKGWDLARDAHTGVVTVTSPDGRIFTRQPASRSRPGRCTFDQPPQTRAPLRC